MAVQLTLTSHARSPPLHPTPDLKFDLRQIQNPPKDVRDRYTGIDKRLREWMVRESGFVELLQKAEEDIRGLAGEKTKGADEEKQIETSIGEESTSCSLDENIEESESEEGDRDDNEFNNEQDAIDTTHATGSASIDISVSCFCAMGKHRSVAFVEELARRDWPKDWVIEAVHRDLTKSKAQKDAKRARNRGKWKGGDVDED